ncbi:hypothetical protein [Lysobacter gummosus]|uniref:hypothetical protein n=1 Tax=Lysobacter gummosus TaxID=262324 RepID=UPI00363678F2
MSTVTDDDRSARDGPTPAPTRPRDPDAPAPVSLYPQGPPYVPLDHARTPDPPRRLLRRR